MTPEELRLAKDVFFAALDRPHAQRSTWLAAQDLSDAVRSQVERQLHQFESRDAEDLAPAVERLARSGPDAPTPPPERIDRYRILRRLGQGGFGVVYLAEQERPLHRLVALKLLRPGMDDRQVVARFAAERQALALMDHPHIAAVFDGGATETGQPFFVMEHVEGVPIHEYCDAARLDLRGRIELFQKVCDAVQHAHQKGVIHRDLKPSNLLVAERDGEAVPKVIDFGIAKAAVSRSDPPTVATLAGEFLGTPDYMSPEQAGADRGDIDTRSDVYSLGTVLFELLTGTTPIASRTPTSDSTALERLLLVRDMEAPKASASVASQSSAARAVAAARGLQPAALVAALRGDLDWILLRALDRDRERRYPTPGELAADLHRHLRDEPVAAAAPALGYRMRKFVRRHRLQVAAVVSVVLALVAGLLAFAWANADARRQTRLAEARAETLERTAYAAEMNEVREALDDGRLIGLEDRLRAWQASPHRGIEWDWLMARARTPEPLWEIVDDAGPTGIEVHPDGHSAVYTVDGDGRPRVVELAAGARPRTLPWPSPFALWTAAGDRLVTRGAESGEVAFWDPQDLDRPVRVVRTGAGELACAARNPGRDEFAVADADTVWLVDARPETPAHRAFTCVHEASRITALAVAPTGGLVATAHLGSVALRRLEDGEVVQRVPYREASFGAPRAATLLRFAPRPPWSRVSEEPSADRLLVAGGRRGPAAVWSVGTGPDAGAVATLTPHHQDYNVLWRVGAVAFVNDGELLLTGGDDCRVRVQDAEYGVAVAVLEFQDQVHALGVLPDQRHFVVAERRVAASGEVTGVLGCYDLAQVAVPVDLGDGDPGGYMAAAFTASGRHVFAVQWGPLGGLVKLDFATGEPVFRHTFGPLASVSLSPDESQVAIAGLHGAAWIVDAKTGAILQRLRIPEEARRRYRHARSADLHLTGLQFDPVRGDTLLAGIGHYIGRWELDVPMPVTLFDLEEHEWQVLDGGQQNAVHVVRFARDGAGFFTAADTGPYQLWRRTGPSWWQPPPSRPQQDLAQPRLPNRSLGIAFHPDGQRCYVTTDLDTVAEFDVTTGALLQQHRLEPLATQLLALDPWAQRLLRLSGRRVDLWDLPPRNRVWSAPTVERYISHAVFEPHGRGVLLSAQFGRLLFHGMPDAAGHDARRIARRARRIVQALLRRHLLADRALAALDDLVTPTAPVHAVARQILEHTYDGPELLERVASGMVEPPDVPDADACQAIALARTGLELAVPDTWQEFLLRQTLGIALLRAGEADGALREFERALAIHRAWSREGEASPRKALGFAAIAAKRLGSDTVADDDQSTYLALEAADAAERRQDEEVAAEFELR